MAKTLTLDELFGEEAAAPAVDVQQLITDTATKYQIHPSAFHAMAKAESNYDPGAVSPKDAQGLFQLNPITRKHLGVKDAFDPAENADAAGRYFSSLLQKYKGDYEKAWAAYNFGPGNVDKGKPLPKETKDYIKKVKAASGIQTAKLNTPSLSEFDLPPQDPNFSMSDRGSMTLDDLYPTAQTGQGAATGQDLLELGKVSALPMIGQMAGIGTGLLTGPFAPVAVPAFEAAGGMMGEALNQKLGITEPSNLQIALQGLIPPGMRGLTQTSRLLGHTFPPTTRGAEFLNRIAAPEARTQLGKLATPDAHALFERAIQSGELFHTHGTTSAIDAELKNLTRGANAEQLYGRTITILKNLQKKIVDGGGYLDPAQYQTELRDLGASLRTAEGRTVNSVEEGAIKKVYGELASALDRESIPPAPKAGTYVEPVKSNPLRPLDEPIQLGDTSVPALRLNTGVGPVGELPRGVTGEVLGAVQQAPARQRSPGTAMAAQDLLQARRYVKRQAVLDELDESVTKAEKILRGQGDNVQFNANVVLKELKDNPFWNGKKGERNPAFTPEEKRYVEKLFTMLNEIPVLQPGAGVNAGSMRKMQRGMLAGAGGTTGGLYSGGDPVITGAATLAGAAVPTIAAFWRVASFAMRTETGRKEILDTLQKATRSGMSLDNVLTVLTGGATAMSGNAMRPQHTAGPTGMPTPFSLEK